MPPVFRALLVCLALAAISAVGACDHDTPEPPDLGGGSCTKLGAACASSSACCSGLSCLDGICDARVSCAPTGGRCGPGVSCCGTATCREVAPNNRVCDDGRCAGRGSACGGGVTCCGTLLCRSNVCAD